jgi:hypothetical protein
VFLVVDEGWAWVEKEVEIQGIKVDEWEIEEEGKWEDVGIGEETKEETKVKWSWERKRRLWVEDRTIRKEKHREVKEKKSNENDKKKKK